MIGNYRLASSCLTVSLAVMLAACSFYQAYSLTTFHLIGEEIVAQEYELDLQKDRQRIQRIKSDLNVLFCVGAAFSALLSSSLINRLGRRPVIFGTEILAVLNCLILIISDRRIMIVSRLVSGIVTGLMYVSFLMITELLPRAIGGIAHSYGYSLYCAGALIAYFMEYLIGHDEYAGYGREALCGTLIMSMIRMFMLCSLMNTESPVHIYDNCDHEDIFDKIRICYSKLFKKEFLNQATFEFLRRQENAKRKLKHQKDNGIDTKGRLKTYMIGVIIGLAYHLTGINFFAFFLGGLLSQMDGSIRLAETSFWSAGLIGSLISMFTINKYGRKHNLVWGSLLQCIAMVPVILSYIQSNYYMMLAGLSVYACCFGVSFGTTFTAKCTEMLSPAAFSCVICVKWMIAAGSFHLFGKITETNDQTYILVTIFALNLVVFLVLSRFAIETKNKGNYEIQNKLDETGLKKFDFT